MQINSSLSLYPLCYATKQLKSDHNKTRRDRTQEKVDIVESSLISAGAPIPLFLRFLRVGGEWGGWRWPLH